MATVTEYDAATAASTSNTSTYASAAFTPAVDDLLIVAVIASGTVDAGDVTVSANGVSSFTRVDRAIFGPTVHSVYLFVANQLTTGTASMTVTFDCTGDNATGAIVMVSAVAGMTKTGATAILQSTKIDDGAGATTPVFTFGASCQTGNVTIYAIGELSTAGLLTPTSWTEGAETSYSTPTIGGAYGYRASGFTGTTVTWPGNETAHGGVFVELDTSGGAVTGVGVASFGFTGAAAGVPTTLGVAAATFGFTAAGAGVPTTFGVAAASLGFTATALGIDTALGVAAAAFGFTGTAAGLPTTFGTAAATFGFTGTVAGIPRPQGVAAASFGFTASAAGIPRVLGAALASLGFTGTASGTTGGVPVTGAAVAAFGFTGAALGVDRALGAAVASLGFTATAAGIDRALGAASAAFGFTATALGVDTALGTTAGAFGFTATSVGQRRVLAVVVATFAGTGTALGVPRVIGVAVASFGFTGSSSGVNPATFRDITATATLHQPWTAVVTRRALGATLHQPWEASLDA